MRTSAPTVTLRAAPIDAAPLVARLPRHTVVRIEGASGTWYRVRLPDGPLMLGVTATLDRADGLALGNLLIAHIEIERLVA